MAINLHKIGFYLVLTLRIFLDVGSVRRITSCQAGGTLPFFFMFGYYAGSVAPLVTYTVSCRTAFKWCEFDPRHAQQLFGTPFSEVALL